MKVLGIDPGFGRTGYAVIDKTQYEPKVLEYGCIETKKQSPFPERLSILNKELREVLKRHNPEKAGVEKLFFNKNITTGIDVSHARGVVLLALYEKRIPIIELTPLQIKQSTTGYGQATKKQMQEMVQKLCKLKEIPKPDDAADALAVAICTADYNVNFEA